MLAIREQARRVRPAEEVQDRPAGLVPPKPPTSWLRHLRTSTDKQNDQTSGLPKVAKIKTKPLHQKPDIYYESPTAVELAGPPARRTVEVKTTALVRLLNPERGTIHDLGIQQVERQFRDKEVEAQYKEFIRLLKVWSQDSAHPESDPLHDFSEYHTFTFKRVYRSIQITGKEPELKPYICILGFNTEEEVKRGHSKLASKKVKSRHCPLLGLCYDLDWEQLAAMPSAHFLRGRPQKTLCGALVSIGDGRDKRIVTIGGLLTDGVTTWALTAGHLPKEAHHIESDSDTLAENDLNLSNYEESVEPPLIILPATSSVRDRVEESDLPGTFEIPAEQLGDIEVVGDEWSLIRIEDASLALPNCVASEHQQPCYLYTIAEEPEPNDANTVGNLVTILGGVTGTSKMRLLSVRSPMRLPGGKWVDAWLGEAETDSQLKRGDSGSWVVDAAQGIVYGHVLSIAGRTVYVLPLADVLQDISTKLPTNRTVLLQPFASLAELAKLHWSKKDHSQAKEYAKQALQLHVIEPFQRQSARGAFTANEFIQWASSIYGLEIADIVYPDLQPQSDTAVDDKWWEKESKDLSSNLYYPVINNAVPSQANKRNPWAQDREKSRRKSYRDLDLKEKPYWSIDIAADTHIDKFLFTELLKTLRCIPEPVDYLEILNYSEPRHDAVVVRPFFDDDDFIDFLARRGRFQPKSPAELFLNGTRLIIQQGAMHPQAFQSNVISLELNQYEFLVQEMKLPFPALEASATAGPFLWWTRNIKQAERSYFQLVFRKSDTQWSGRGSRGFEIILSHSFETRITSGYVRGTHHAKLGQVLQQLATCSTSTAHPLLLPILVLCRELGFKNDEFHQATRRWICTLEATLGDRYHVDYVNNHTDTEQLLRDIIACQYQVLQKRPQAWLKVVSKLTQAMGSYWESLDPENKTLELEQLHETLLGRLDFFTTKLQGLESYIQVSSERLKILREGVNHILALRESRVSLEMAAQHRHIARITKEDSVSMKSITLLTMFFLPGTFVASFFSTNFFDFTNGDINPASNRLWVYFVIVIPLTILVLGAWWGYDRVRGKKAASEDREDESNLESRIMEGIRKRRMAETTDLAWENKV